jgi:hypothetical protein
MPEGSGAVTNRERLGKIAKHFSSRQSFIGKVLVYLRKQKIRNISYR